MFDNKRVKYFKKFADLAFKLHYEFLKETSFKTQPTAPTLYLLRDGEYEVHALYEEDGESPIELAKELVFDINPDMYILFTEGSAIIPETEYERQFINRSPRGTISRMPNRKDEFAMFARSREGDFEISKSWDVEYDKSGRFKKLKNLGYYDNNPITLGEINEPDL